MRPQGAGSSPNDPSVQLAGGTDDPSCERTHGVFVYVKLHVARHCLEPSEVVTAWVSSETRGASAALCEHDGWWSLLEAWTAVLHVRLPILPYRTIAEITVICNCSR